MLEQNTDRSYWMIGGVIVIGTLITLCSVAFPDLMDVVVKIFQAKVPAF